MIKEILRNSIAVGGIVFVSLASFMVSQPLGFLVVGLFCLVVAVGDRLIERSQPGDRRRTR